MKRCLSVLFLGLALVLCTHGRAPAADSPGPRILLPETLFQFGEVQEGEVVKHAFSVQNKGTQVLEITDVKPG